LIKTGPIFVIEKFLFDFWYDFVIMVLLMISFDFLLAKAKNALKKLIALTALKMDLVLEVSQASLANLGSDG
jgi:hypothetical protein